MDVEVELYSGRPNPRFRLDPAAAAELLRRLGALRPSAGSSAPREGLGYRGLRIEPADDAAVAGIFVSGGLVLVRGKTGEERRLHDAGRALERWLIAAGERFLDPGTVTALRDDLDGD